MSRSLRKNNSKEFHSFVGSLWKFIVAFLSWVGAKIDRCSNVVKNYTCNIVTPRCVCVCSWSLSSKTEAGKWAKSKWLTERKIFFFCLAFAHRIVNCNEMKFHKNKLSSNIPRTLHAVENNISNRFRFHSSNEFAVNAICLFVFSFEMFAFTVRCATAHCSLSSNPHSCFSWKKNSVFVFVIYFSACNIVFGFLRCVFSRFIYLFSLFLYRETRSNENKLRHAFHRIEHRRKVKKKWNRSSSNGSKRQLLCIRLATQRSLFHSFKPKWKKIKKIIRDFDCVPENVLAEFAYIRIARMCTTEHNISWLAFICMRRRAQSSDPKYYMVIKSWAIVTCADYVDVVVVAGRETHRKCFGFFFSFRGPMAKQTHFLRRMWIAFENFFSKKKIAFPCVQDRSFTTIEWRLFMKIIIIQHLSVRCAADVDHVHLQFSR